MTTSLQDKTDHLTIKVWTLTPDLHNTAVITEVHRLLHWTVNTVPPGAYDGFTATVITLESDREKERERVR